MRRTAFTLMELLIVVSIILLLMGMLFVGLRIAREQANKVKTQAAMAELKAELDKYKQVNGRYPENEFEAAPSYFGPVSGPKEFGQISLDDWKNVNILLVQLLNAGGSSLTSPLKDGWGQPLHYRPAKFYPYNPAAGTVAIDGDDPPGRDSYQVWSTGTDKTDHGGAKVPANDDVISWGEKR